MSEKTIFENIKEKIDELIMGRRYLISEMGKLKISVDKMAQVNLGDIKGLFDDFRSNVGNLSQMGDQLKQITDLTNNLSTMSDSLKNMQSSLSSLSDLQGISNQITKAASQISGLQNALIEIRDSIRGLNELKEGFEATLATLGEFRIAMNGLKETMDKMTTSFEGIASLADLGSLAKTLKPDIKELTDALSGIRELRQSISDLAKQTASIGDMKVLTSELRVAMREIRSAMSSGSVATPISTPAASSPPVPKPTMVVKRPSTTAPTPTIKTEEKPKVYSAGRTKISTPTASPISETPEKPSIAPSVKQAAIQSEAKSKAGKEKKVPDIVEEVFSMIVQRAQGGADAHSLSKVIDNARDTISKSWKWHPALYELGAFSRKLRNNFKENELPSKEMVQLLMQKISEWKDKMAE
jgi:division protein CdvB (Snf7/Vps24/ESCRT-III family)